MPAYAQLSQITARSLLDHRYFRLLCGTTWEGESEESYYKKGICNLVYDPKAEIRIRKKYDERDVL